MSRSIAAASRRTSMSGAARAAIVVTPRTTSSSCGERSCRFERPTSVSDRCQRRASARRGHHLIGAGDDVRDCCANRTAERARQRRQGRSDALDAERIAVETLADPGMPVAFEPAGEDVGPDETTELFRCGTTPSRASRRRSPFSSPTSTGARRGNGASSTDTPTPRRPTTAPPPSVRQRPPPVRPQARRARHRKGLRVPVSHGSVRRPG